MSQEDRPRLLLVYATRSGSTAQVAEAVAKALRSTEADVDMRTLASDPDPSEYDVVVVGGPMLMGWHRDAVGYVRRHRDSLAARRTAFFITAASLTDQGEDQVDGIPVVADPWLAKRPRVDGRLSLKERYARPAHYLASVRKKAPQVRPVTVAFFGGCLDLTKLRLWEKLFVLLVIRASPGDGRHWDFIRTWATSLGSLLGPTFEGGLAAGVPTETPAGSD